MLYKNNFICTKKNITQKDILAIENKYNFEFPKDLIDHYLVYNGGKPKKNIFMEDDYEFVVNYFLPIKYGVNGRTLEAVLDIFRDDEDFPNWLIPFADEPGGDLYCFSVNENDQGSIYYWDHECTDGVENSYGYLAATLKEFIDSMVD